MNAEALQQLRHDMRRGWGTGMSYNRILFSVSQMATANMDTIRILLGTRVVLSCLCPISVGMGRPLYYLSSLALPPQQLVKYLIDIWPFFKGKKPENVLSIEMSFEKNTFKWKHTFWVEAMIENFSFDYLLFLVFQNFQNLLILTTLD